MSSDKKEKPVAIAFNGKDDNEDTETKTIVIAVSGSKHSDYAVNWAVQNYVKHSQKNKVILVTILEPLSEPILAANDDFEVLQTKLSDDASNYLIRIRDILIGRGCGLEHIEMNVCFGIAEEEIVRIVKASQARVLVLGSRGLGGERYTVTHSALI